jgi:hypothetical protein
LPFTVSDAVPGGPPTNPAILPAISDAPGQNITSPPNPNPVNQIITNVVAMIPAGNDALGTPIQTGSPSSLPPSVLLLGPG